MKSKRQEKILELIKEKIFLTQEELQNALIEAGYDVTQSTVSRDIKKLRIVKGHDRDGNYRYIAAEQTAPRSDKMCIRDRLISSPSGISSASSTL